VVIDDLVRKHNADLIIDQTLMRTQTEYRSLNNTNDILTGCEYALLNPQFIARREQALDINCIPQRPKILISMGGIDNDNITLKVLRILQSQSYNTIKVTVLLGKKSPNYEDVKEFCILNDEWVEHKDFVDDMASTMLGHTLAIGAPGTTSWERACLGIPNIIIPLADNQLTIARNLVLVNASILVEKDNISRDLVNSCKMLIKKWSEYRQANLKLCDGLGVRRVVMSVNNLLNKQVNRLSIRRACENDIKPVFEWQCHSNTRKYALTTSVPKWDDHKSWMKQKLKSVKDFFYMITLAEYDESVGVIRLDRLKKGEYIVSIFVSPKHYGKGIAKHALNFVDGIHKDVTLHATVLENNIASQRLFTAANYQRVTKDKFIRLPIT
jgi:spore coat polysaccharide biosynthesis predicted glycosyltransferase SpsG/RimJ/RimL family protein N-acetyltransferase